MEFLQFIGLVVCGAAVFALAMGGSVKLLHDYQARDKNASGTQGGIVTSV